MDARTDEYALACTAFTMLTGAPPFTRDESVAVMWAQVSAPPPPLTSRRPDLPPAVDQVMAKALAKVPMERYGTCPQFADALRRACGLEPGARGSGSAPARVPGPEPTQVSGWPPGPPGGPGRPRAADPAPPSHPGTAVSGVPLAGLSQPAEPAGGPEPAGPPGSAGPPGPHWPPHDVTSPGGPDHPAPPSGQDHPSAPRGQNHPGEYPDAAPGLGEYPGAAYGPADYPSAASGHDRPGQGFPPSDDPDYAGLWRPAPADDQPGEPPTEGVPPTSGSGWPGPPPPARPGYPGPGRRPRRRRWQTAAGVAVGAAAVLAAGAFFLVGRQNGASQDTAATALQPPGCTTKVAKAAQLKHLSRHMTGTGGQPFDVATRPGFAFVSIASGVAVLDTSQPVPRLMWTAPMGHAQGEALTPDGQYLLVSSGSGLAVFRVNDLENGAAGPVGSLSSPGQKHAVEVAVTPNGHYALVTYQNTSNVGVFNLHRALHKGFSPADLVGLIPVGPQPIGVAVAPDGGLAYVTSGPRRPTASGNGVVNVIDMAKAETRPAAAVTKTVSAGCKPSRVVLSADGQQMWVTAGGSNMLLGFSVPKLLSDPGQALLARVPVGPLPLGLMIVNHGTRIVVADSDRDNQPGVGPSLAVVNVSKALAGQPALLGYAQTGTTPRQFALASNGSTLLVTNTGTGQLESLNAAKLP